MNIRVGNYEISGDENQFILSEIKIIQDGGGNFKAKPENIGKERVSILGYYGRLDHLVNRLLTLQLQQSDAETLEQLVATLNRATSDLAAAIAAS